MAKWHTALQGECLSSIAEACGFYGHEAIYLHPENAGFRQQRPNPNILYPGDVLFIPDVDVKECVGASDQKHTFVMKRRLVRLRLRLEDDFHTLYAHTRYELRVGSAHWQGSTDGSGMVDQEIPTDAAEGEITIFPAGVPADPAYTFPLQLGHLDPVEEDSGVDARLLNLGYGQEDAAGQLAPEARTEALKQFQAAQGLEASGELTDETRKRLRELHDGE